MSALVVMARVMHVALAAKNRLLALSAAAQLAPYISPNLSHITNTVTSEPNKMTDAELQELLAKIKATALDASVAGNTNVVKLKST
jgi:2,4-dienoyl-CoA reductase-like NADH-dependent reductase (Old Yellow Enzyme family)